MVEYKLEGYNLFLEMMASIRRNTIYNVYMFQPAKVPAACHLAAVDNTTTNVCLCVGSLPIACPCCREPSLSCITVVATLWLCLCCSLPCSPPLAPRHYSGIAPPSSPPFSCRIQAATASVTAALLSPQAANVVCSFAFLVHALQLCRWLSRGNNSKSSNNKCSRMQISRKLLLVMLWWMLLLRRPPAMAVGQEMGLLRMAPLVANRRAKRPNRRRPQKGSRQSGESFVNGSHWDWCSTAVPSSFLLKTLDQSKNVAFVKYGSHSNHRQQSRGSSQ